MTERMSYHAEVWRQRQVENDARWEQTNRELRAWDDRMKAATTAEEFEALVRWRPGERLP
jgi:hypothetical protein